jgi:hypothetical protein
MDVVISIGLTAIIAKLVKSNVNFEAICSSEILNVFTSSLQQSSLLVFLISFTSSQQQFAFSNKFSEAKFPLQ